MQVFQTAAVTRLRAAYTTARVHEPNQVPASPALPYAVVSASTGLPRNYRISGDHGTRQVRVVVQCIGATAADCLFVAEKADVAFLDQAPTVTGWTTTKARREIEASPQRDPDDTTAVYALATYTYEARSDA